MVGCLFDFYCVSVQVVLACCVLGSAVYILDYEWTLGRTWFVSNELELLASWAYERSCEPLLWYTKVLVVVPQCCHLWRDHLSISNDIYFELEGDVVIGEPS